MVHLLTREYLEKYKEAIGKMKALPTGVVTSPRLSSRPIQPCAPPLLSRVCLEHAASKSDSCLPPSSLSLW
ncbi:hypothetical protein PR202_ga00200 [Eleusine coracana subsp. coracana]|uniref:Uncharacterized protein n=1 Tax=Eleusine coracana subsp. coracana TaxID=191504 RepID=A0AAV5BFT6_ELECO|nr:hypothetical protein PR202_ga00200 [Eleusine coracana subsp. coracana]